MTTVSSATSHSTVNVTRSPRKPYGIHISTCVQARNTAASRAGQINGRWMPHGHRARRAVASVRVAMATVPYSIGHPASAAVVTGSVNRRAG